MLESAARCDLTGARILEIGGGIGRLQIELLGAGAERGEVVELVSAYEPYARELARDKGFEARTSFRVVDILEDPGAVEPADVVLLDRVVCCSPDGVALTREAARLARGALVLSYPRYVLSVRAGVRAMNLGLRLMGRSYRAFVHSPEALSEAAADGGLTIADRGHGLGWEFATFWRAA